MVRKQCLPQDWDVVADKLQSFVGLGARCEVALIFFDSGACVNSNSKRWVG